MSVNYTKAKTTTKLIPKKKYINRNGQYRNFTFNLGSGYKINANNKIIWQSHGYNGIQHFPIFLKAQQKLNMKRKIFEASSIGNTPK